MPIIQIHLMAGRTAEQKRTLVKEVTQAICNSLGNKPDSIRIILSEMEQQDYAVGGVLKADEKKSW